MRLRMPRRAAIALAAVLGVALIGGALAAGAAAGIATPAPTPSTSANPFAAHGLQDPSTADGATARAAGTPTRIRIPAIGVDTALEHLSLGAGGALSAPADYNLAGWYAGGVVPGQVGPAIIAGHVDSPTAPAVFARIADLRIGDTVIVTMSSGASLTFTIDGRTQSAKSNFPTADVYRNVPAPELRLITCAGSFDPAIGHYTDNLILFASLDD